MKARKLKTTRGSAAGIIGSRAETIGAPYGVSAKGVTAAAVWYDKNVHPLRVTDMALGSDINLAHDIGGIVAAIFDGPDEHWTPRYAK